MQRFLIYVATCILYMCLVWGVAIPYIFIRSIKDGIKARSWRAFNDPLNKYFYNSSYALDEAGNSGLEPPANDWFIMPEGHRFGNSKETLSFVFGVNKKKFTMYNVGYFVAELVDAVFALFGDINHIDKTTEKHG